VGRQAHLPFGEDFAESGAQQKQHFTSYERDSETNTDYAVNRQYAQSAAKFNQIDPLAGNISDPQSLNRFSYVGNDPVNRTDPVGLGWKLVLECTGIRIPGAPYSPGCHFVWVWEPGAGESSTPITPAPPIVIPPPPSGQGSAVRKTSSIPDNLRARLRQKLQRNGSECGNFVKSLIDKAAEITGKPAYSDDLLALYDAISGSGGGGYVLSDGPLQLGGHPAGGTVTGSFANLGASSLRPTVIISPLIYYNLGNEQNQASYVNTALHETIHLAATQGSYSDLDLADAVFKLGGLSQKEMDAYQNIDRTDPFSSSAFWDGVLSKHCN
jgi:RHS repeat-associated protein